LALALETPFALHRASKTSPSIVLEFGFLTSMSVFNNKIERDFLTIVNLGSQYH
jgi:hypothetical protein